MNTSGNNGNKGKKAVLIAAGIEVFVLCMLASLLIFSRVGGASTEKAAAATETEEIKLAKETEGTTETSAEKTEIISSTSKKNKAETKTPETEAAKKTENTVAANVSSANSTKTSTEKAKADQEAAAKAAEEELKKQQEEAAKAAEEELRKAAEEAQRAAEEEAKAAAEELKRQQEEAIKAAEEELKRQQEEAQKAAEEAAKAAEEALMAEAKRTYYNPNNINIMANMVSVFPYYVYFESDGTMVAECYVVNGYSTTGYNIDVQDITIRDINDTLVAEAGFGYLTDSSGNSVYINSGSYITWTFKFKPQYVKTTSPDFSGISCAYSIGNNY